MGNTPIPLPEVKRNWRSGGVPSGSLMNTIGSILSNITGRNGIRVLRNYQNNGLIIEADATDSDDGLTFNCTKVGNVITISAGRITFSDVSHEVAEGDVTLTGAKEYVYVYIDKDLSGAPNSGFDHASTYPLSNGAKWCWVLCEYSATDGVYTRDAIHHRGSINENFPLS